MLSVDTPRYPRRIQQQASGTFSTSPRAPKRARAGGGGGGDRFPRARATPPPPPWTVASSLPSSLPWPFSSCTRPAFVHKNITSSSIAALRRPDSTPFSLGPRTGGRYNKNVCCLVPWLRRQRDRDGSRLRGTCVRSRSMRWWQPYPRESGTSTELRLARCGSLVDGGPFSLAPSRRWL